ncbi:MAG: hypothetical protein JRJ85_24235 [Deltaproteobacteria bacterium]|nr:hypothetical protein [Deltaproteobacteria bacterium]
MNLPSRALPGLENLPDPAEAELIAINALFEAARIGPSGKEWMLAVEEIKNIIDREGRKIRP